MACCSVKVPFGEAIIADMEVEYDVDRVGVDPDSLAVTCAGFWVGSITDMDRRYVAFAAKFGPEAALRDRFVESALAVWQGRILDACKEHAEENKEVNAFVRG
jgi:hypothetical protein